MKKITFIAAIFSMMYLSSCGDAKTASTSPESTEEVVSTEEVTTEEEVEEAPSSDGGTVVGTWKLSEVDLAMEIPAEQKEMFDGMMNAMKESTTMTFNEDGTFASTSKVMGQEKNETGNWTLDGMTLISSNSEGRNDTVTLTKLTSSNFTIVVGEGEKQMTMTFAK